MSNEFKIEIKKGLRIINILLIIVFALGILFIGSIEYLREQDGEHKEIVTDWEHPNITWSGEELITIPLLLGIYLLATNKKKKIINAEIKILKDKIVVSYLNKIYTINIKNIKNIKYEYDKEKNNYFLKFNGNKNMMTDNKNKSSNSYDLIFKEDISDLCKKIKDTTNLEIKNFND